MRIILGWRYNFLFQRDDVLIFSDGSKTINEVGTPCASLHGSLSTVRSINSLLYIFTEECIAFNDAFDMVLESDRTCCTFSDSLSTL